MRYLIIALLLLALVMTSVFAVVGQAWIRPKKLIEGGGQADQGDPVCVRATSNGWQRDCRCGTDDAGRWGKCVPNQGWRCNFISYQRCDGTGNVLEECAEYWSPTFP